MNSLTFTRLNATQASSQLESLIDLYVTVYSDANDDFFGEERYRRQITGHLTAPSWELVAAHDNGHLVGYIYGFALPGGTRWWQGLTSQPSDSFSHEDGSRTVAISEILVHEDWRRKGVARALHDKFLEHRNETRATLLVEPENEPANAAYLKWGWRQVAQLRPSWEGAPLYDVLILPMEPHVLT